MKAIFSLKEATHKIEQYCSYQERCHEEVKSKLISMKIDYDEIDYLISHLINENFLNEARFACSFARGKHRIKYWGRVRIVNELKFRKINQRLINLALKEITEEEYETNFNFISERIWLSAQEKNPLKKNQKVASYLLRKGFENDLVFQRIKELQAENG